MGGRRLVRQMVHGQDDLHDVMILFWFFLDELLVLYGSAMHCGSMVWTQGRCQITRCVYILRWYTVSIINQFAK